MSDSDVLRIHTDGASRGNPGAAAFAYVIQRDGEEPIEEAETLGDMTNNQAEYTALVRALEHAHEIAPHSHVNVFSDSELMVRQMNGEYRVKNEELRGLYEQARKLCDRFPAGVTIRHVRRAANSRADALCNEVLDGKRLPSVRSLKLGPRLSSAPAPAPAPSLPPARPQKTPAHSALHVEANDCLYEAAKRWAVGIDPPETQEVWKKLLAILARHGIQVPPPLTR
jgi:ribonuclease HI